MLGFTREQFEDLARFRAWKNFEELLNSDGKSIPADTFTFDFVWYNTLNTGKVVEHVDKNVVINCPYLCPDGVNTVDPNEMYGDAYAKWFIDPPKDVVIEYMNNTNKEYESYVF